jgi:hypothetical protein
MKYSTLLLACALSMRLRATLRDAPGASNPAQAPATKQLGKSATSLNVPADASLFAKLTTPIVITQAKTDDAVEAQTTLL